MPPTHTNAHHAHDAPGAARGVARARSTPSPPYHPTHLRTARAVRGPYSSWSCSCSQSSRRRRRAGRRRPQGMARATRRRWRPQRQPRGLCAAATPARRGKARGSAGGRQGAESPPSRGASCRSTAAWDQGARTRRDRIARSQPRTHKATPSNESLTKPHTFSHVTNPSPLKKACMMSWLWSVPQLAPCRPVLGPAQRSQVVLVCRGSTHFWMSTGGCSLPGRAASPRPSQTWSSQGRRWRCCPQAGRRAARPPRRRR